jgi:hypothetical protein
LSRREVALRNGLDEVTSQQGMRIAHCGLPSRIGGAAFVIARSWLSPVAGSGIAASSSQPSFRLRSKAAVPI